LLNSASAAELPTGLYATAQVVNNQFNPDQLPRTNQLGLGVGVGYQWLSWLSFEVRGEKGLGGNYGSNYEGFDSVYQAELAYKFSGLAKFQYRFDSGWTPFLLAGVTRNKNLQYDEVDRETSFSYGAGINYPFKVKGGEIDVGIEYLFIDDDDDTHTLNSTSDTELGYSLNSLALVINYRY
jgi:opacity protein-like surface antigen